MCRIDKIAFIILFMAKTISFASAVTMTANPSPVEIPTGSLGSTTISWPAPGVSTVALYVSMDLGSENLMWITGGTVAKSKTATWIQRSHTYDFNLYQGSDNTGLLLGTVRVEGYKLLRANRYISVPSGDYGSCKISFGPSGYSIVQLYVSENGGSDTLMWQTSGTIPRTNTATWIQNGHDYVFKLYANTDKTTLLDQTTVTGTMHMPLESSDYLSLSSDTAITSTIELLSEEIYISGNEHDVYVQSDGRYYPSYYQDDNCSMYIAVDGQRISNKSTIGWYTSNTQVQHCFNCIGLTNLPSGTHKFALVAEHNGSYSDFVIGAAANLSIMIDPAPKAMQSVLASDHMDVDLDTDFYTEGDTLPYETVVSHTFPSDSRDVVALISGVNSGIYGDAMWGIYLNNAHQGNMTSSWTVNDMWTGAELLAPMYTHAFFDETATASSDTISFVATEFPWKGDVEPALIYDVLADSRLVSLGGGLSVCGRDHFVPSSIYDFYQWKYKCIGGLDESLYPPLDSSQLITSETITIPTGHNGIVMFDAKFRCQGATIDQGGLVRIWIVIDGQMVGPTGVQQLTYPDCVSQRTLCTSYLATGENALSEGTHTVSVYGKASGSFQHLSLHCETALVWFD